MKLLTKGLTRKQIITILEDKIRNDNVCITEGAMSKIFDRYGDTYEASIERDETIFVLKKLNEYWSIIRMFLPRLGDKLKGFKDNEHEKADS